MKCEAIEIETEYIPLDSLLKLAGVIVTGGQAKGLIAEGKVLVNGVPCLQRKKKLYPGDTVAVEEQSFEVCRRED